MHTLSHSQFINRLLQYGSWIALAALIFNLCVNCPVQPVHPSINFDDGWVSANNYLPFSQYIPGKDYFSNYGPLGFIDYCRDIQPNKLLAQLFFLFEHIAIGWVLWLYRRSFPHGRFIVFAAAMLVSQFATHGDPRTPAGDEYTAIVALAMLLSVSLISKNTARLFSMVLGAIFASLLIFIKFDLAIAVIATLAAYISLASIFNNVYSRKLLIIFWGILFLSVLALCFVFFKNLSNYVNWIFYNIHNAGGWLDGWSIEPSVVDYCLGLAIAVIYLPVILSFFGKKKQLSYLGMTLLPSLLLGFLHGFARGDPFHIATFCKYTIVVMAFLLIFCDSKRIMIWLLLSVFGLGWRISLVDDTFKKNWYSAGNQPSRLESMILSEKFLPAEIKQDNTFDGIPVNMEWCFANHLHYKPNPFIVLSNACLSSGDHLGAVYFGGDCAPDYLFCEFCAIDSKNVFFETPQSWRSIMDCYQVRNFDFYKQVLLLQKSKTQNPENLEAGDKFKCFPNVWYKVPSSTNLLYVSLDCRLNNLGKILRIFYPVPPLFLNVKYADGHMQSFRLIPGVSKGGVLINYLPEDMKALKQLFEGKAQNWVTEFELAGDSIPYYQTPIESIWMKQNSKVIDVKAAGTVTPCRIDVGNPGYTIICSFRGDPVLSAQRGNMPVFDRKKQELACFYLLVLRVENGNISHEPAKAAWLRIDDGPPIRTSSRNLVYESGGCLPNRESLTAGFRTAIPIYDLKPGAHKIQFNVQSMTDGRIYRIPGSIPFEVD